MLDPTYTDGEDVRYPALQLTHSAWMQAQLSLGFGGFGLRSLSHHSCAAFVASLSSSGYASADNQHYSMQSTIWCHQLKKSQLKAFWHALPLSELCLKNWNATF